MWNTATAGSKAFISPRVLTDYSAPFGAWTSEDVEYFEVDKGWLNDAHEANDVALIVLNDDIAAKTGKLPLSIDGAKAQRLHLSGYAGGIQSRK